MRGLKKCAIIPARGGSKRLPRKNILPIFGHAMLSYPIRICLESGLFDRVIVSTEDEEISTVAQQYGAQVIRRPYDMATDTAHELIACQQVLDVLSRKEAYIPDYFCVVYATAVLLAPTDLQASYQVLIEEQSDVLMAVSNYPLHPFKALQKNSSTGFYEMVYPEQCKSRSQTYPSYVASNGTFYWFRTPNDGSNLTYYPLKLSVYMMPIERAPDIDTQDDLNRAIGWMAILSSH